MTTHSQRMAPVELLEWACQFLLLHGAPDHAKELRAIIDGPGVEPVAWLVTFRRNAKSSDTLVVRSEESAAKEVAPHFIESMAPLYLAAAPQPPAAVQPSAVACPAEYITGGYKQLGDFRPLSVTSPPQEEPKRKYTMGDWWSDLDNPHRNR